MLIMCFISHLFALETLFQIVMAKEAVKYKCVRFKTKLKSRFFKEKYLSMPILTKWKHMFIHALFF